MSLISESERSELLEFADAFYMAKIMRNEGIKMPNIHHGTTHPNVVFTECLLHLKDKYPYYEMRIPKPGEHEKIFIIRPSLPAVLKSEHKNVHYQFNRVFSYTECFYGELSCKRHYNELHVEVFGCASYHDILEGLIEKLKELKKKEESIA